MSKVVQSHYSKDFFKQRVLLNNYCRDVLQNGDEPELFAQHFVRSTSAFLLDLFLGFKALWYYLALLFVWGIMFMGKKLGDDPEFNWVGLTLFGVLVFCYVVRVIFHLYTWHYQKNIIVTNNGIWQVSVSTFYWNKGFDGKKHLVSISWSIYDWRELDEIKTYTDRIARGLKLQNIILCRWDGNLELPYLKQADAAALAQLAEQYLKKRPRQKQPAKTRPLPKSIDFFRRLENLYTGRKDEA